MICPLFKFPLIPPKFNKQKSIFLEDILLKVVFDSSIKMSANRFPKEDSNTPSLILKDFFEYPITFCSFLILFAKYHDSFMWEQSNKNF